MQRVGMLGHHSEHAAVNLRGGFRIAAALRLDCHLNHLRDGDLFDVVNIGGHAKMKAGADAAGKSDLQHPA